MSIMIRFLIFSFIDLLSKSLINLLKTIGILIISGFIFCFTISIINVFSFNFFAHPSISTFVSVILMLLFYQFDGVFKVISIIYPIISIYSLLFSGNLNEIKILNLNFIIDCNVLYILLAAAIIFVTCSINIYAISRNRKPEILIAGLYLGFSLIALFSLDFISQFVAIELMAVCAAIIIFIGSNKNSLESAKSYFLIHLFGGSLVLIGICYIFTTSSDTQITNLVYLINNSKVTQSNVFYYLILLGCLINISAFPISNWMVNYYPSASSSGFIYLNLFSTKISIVLMIKLFCGLQLLKYLGIAMIIYASICACIEDNNRKVSCYLAVAQLGFMLIGISIGSKFAILGVLLYLSIYTLYKSLLALVFAVLLDEAKIENCSELKSIKSIIINISLWLSLLMMFGFPLSASILSKSLIYQNFKDDIFINIIKIANIIVFLSLPFKKFLWNQQSVRLKINKYIFISLLSLVLALLASNYFMIYSYQFIFKSSIADDFSKKVIQQLIIIVIGIALSFLPLPKIRNKRINLDLLLVLSSIFKTCYHLCLRAKLIPIDSFVNKIFHFSHRIKYISHNQSTSLCIVILLLTIMLMTVHRL